MIVEARKPRAGWHEWKPRPGHIYVDLPENVYHDSPGISKHGLDEIARSPAHYKANLEHPREISEDMMVGSAIDCLIFEPHDFDRRYVVDDTGLRRNHNDWKEWANRFARNKEILREHQFDHVRRMRDAVFANRNVQIFLSDGYPQPAFYWLDTEPREHTSGAPTLRLCRGRGDWLCEAHSLAIDMKKVADARKSRFMAQVKNYRYHVQEEFYRYGLRACDHPVDHFMFLLVEDKPPYGVRLLQLKRKWRDQGRYLWEAAMERYERAMQTMEWEGYPEDPESLDFPAYADVLVEV